MRLLDQIEELLKPLRRDLATNCVLCGECITAGYGESGDWKVCGNCTWWLAVQQGMVAEGDDA